VVSRWWEWRPEIQREIGLGEEGDGHNTYDVNFLAVFSFVSCMESTPTATLDQIIGGFLRFEGGGVIN
jgi:hypothetical protein